MKLWQKNIKLDPQIEHFTVDEDTQLDLKLVNYDCTASIAHAKMLGKINILKEKEVEKLVSELQYIQELNRKGKFIILQEHEDCHTAIENHLTKKLGELGKKIHTARSRNDQVLTALRLYYKDEQNKFQEKIQDLCRALQNLKDRYGEIQFPGYTHTRKAMVSSIGLWSEAFTESMNDNLKLIQTSWKLIDQSPLGTGAGYGVPVKIDREYTARLLGFSNIQKNPLYVQNSRGKFETTLIHTLSQIMFDLNRIATDIILFSMPELGYFELPEEFCTGSSIMPQKKNPDVLELVRAKYHTVVSHEFELKTIIGNLISGYHRDLQITKKPVIESIEITQTCLSVMSLVIQSLKINKEKCKTALTDEVYATEKVYELVKKGIPFREAYKKVSEKYS